MSDVNQLNAVDAAIAVAFTTADIPVRVVRVPNDPYNSGVDVCVELDPVNPVKELEANPTVLEHLIERRKYDVAHPRAHAPEERSAVREEHPHRAAKRHASREPRSRHIAVLERERQIVDATHKARVERRL